MYKMSLYGPKHLKKFHLDFFRKMSQFYDGKKLIEENKNLPLNLSKGQDKIFTNHKINNFLKSIENKSPIIKPCVSIVSLKEGNSKDSLTILRKKNVLSPLVKPQKMNILLSNKKENYKINSNNKIIRNENNRNAKILIQLRNSNNFKIRLANNLTSSLSSDSISVKNKKLKSLSKDNNVCNSRINFNKKDNRNNQNFNSDPKTSKYKIKNKNISLNKFYNKENEIDKNYKSYGNIMNNLRIIYHGNLLLNKKNRSNSSIHDTFFLEHIINKKKGENKIIKISKESKNNI